METVKILHCADVHIGAASSVLGERGQNRRVDALLSFENTIELCRGKGTHIMLIAGDLLCSNSVERSAVSRVLECIGSIPDTEVVFSAGNHDPLNSESPFKSAKLPDNFHIMPTNDSFVSFPELGTRVYGRSFSEVYMQGERRFSLVPDSDYINIMCQHGEIKSDLSSDYNSIIPEFIENCGMDYIALGHIHKRSEPSRRGNTYFAYSGCTQGLGFDELGEKGVLAGEVGKGICNLDFYKTCVRTHECFTADTSGIYSPPEIAEKVLGELRDKYKKSFADNLYKIILTGTADENQRIDTSEIAERLMGSVYYAKVSDKTSVLENAQILRQEKSLKGIFVSKMLDRINSCTEEEKETLVRALDVGIKAFCSEVNYDED